MNWNLTQTTSLNLNGSARYDNFRCYRTGDHNYGASANAFLGLKQLLPWGLKANVMGGYNSGAVQAQGKGTSNFFHLLTLSRSFLPEDRLTVTLQGVNFIHPRQKFTTRVETEAFRSVQTMRIEPYRIGVSLTYRIGKLQTQVKKAQRSIQNDDVMKGNSSSAPPAKRSSARAFAESPTRSPSSNKSTRRQNTEKPPLQMERWLFRSRLLTKKGPQTCEPPFTKQFHP